MNEVQLAVVGVIATIVIIIIGYYIYQERKFKKLIENNFNQATHDALSEEQGLVFANQIDNNEHGLANFERDVAVSSAAVDQGGLVSKLEPMPTASSKVLPTEIDFDQVLDPRANANGASSDQFIEFDQVAFPFAGEINADFDHVIEVVFTHPAKFKLLPDLSQYAPKNLRGYILDKSGGWLKFNLGQKYVAYGVKLVVSLVDGEGVCSILQLENIYTEISNFATYHKGHLRQTDSELKLRKIQQQVKNISTVELELELFMVNRESVELRHLAKYFVDYGLVCREGKFEFQENGKIGYTLSDEHGQPFQDGRRYNLFAIRCKLHQQSDPVAAIERVLDFAESYVQYFEARLLTTNQQVMAEKDYLSLHKQINQYVANCKRQGIELGSELIERVLA